MEELSSFENQNSTRRQFLAAGVALGIGGARGQRSRVMAALSSSGANATNSVDTADTINPANTISISNTASTALIAITLDLEMSRGFPTPDQTHWDYHKGDLDRNAIAYTVRLAQRVKDRGGQERGRIHAFVVGQTLEQADVDWLAELVRQGHRIGSHTYDHVNIKAINREDLQPRFKRAPWLVGNKSAEEFIVENIRMNTEAIRSRLHTEPVGFRTPGGFANGLIDRPDVQKMLMQQGFSWVSSQYPAPSMGKPGAGINEQVASDIIKSQKRAQPFAYPSGLIEIPVSPPSDIAAFRDAKWSLADFLKAVRIGVEWAIEHRAVYDFIAHPSCLGVVDPELRTVDLICDLVQQSNGRARLVDLDTVASDFKVRAQQRAGVIPATSQAS